MQLFVVGTNNLFKQGKIAEDFFSQVDEAAYGVDEYQDSGDTAGSSLVEVIPPIVNVTDEIQ